MTNKKNINRKDFFKLLGGTAVTSTAVLYGCKPKSIKVKAAGSFGIKDLEPEKMEYRTNPYSGDKVSLLGYGCMRLPMKQVSDNKEEIDQEAWNDLVDEAIEYGVNYFDTSPMYSRGQSETVTGVALSRHSRDKYYIATKLSNFRPETHSREESIKMYRNSFKDLQVDYIDYYLLHAVGMGGMDNFTSRYIDNGMIDFLLKEKEAGRIRNLGWSFHGDVKVFDYLLAMDIQWDFVQIQLNYVDWQHAESWNVNAEYLYSELVKHKVPAVIMEPILGGRLAKLPNVLMAKLKQQRPESSVASWAFRYAGTPSEVLTVLSGMTYKEHLVDNLHTYSPLDPVTKSEYELLDEITELILEYPLNSCTECRYCMPCPYGIDIPGVFAHYNKCINEGTYPKSLQDEDYSDARKAFLVGYDRSVPKLRQASHCINCNKCVSLCPQRINIPREMNRIDEFVEKLKQGKELV